MCMQLIVCAKCGVSKPSKDFCLDKRHRNGHYSFCRKCHNKYRDYTSFPARFSYWKKNAKKKGWEFDLNLQDIQSLPFVCHYTGKELTTNPNHQNTVSLDRVDSNKGYTKDNVVLCCEIVNRMKQELSCKDFFSYCRLIIHIADNTPFPPDC